MIFWRSIRIFLIGQIVSALTEQICDHFIHPLLLVVSIWPYPSLCFVRNRQSEEIAGPSSGGSRPATPKLDRPVSPKPMRSPSPSLSHKLKNNSVAPTDEELPPQEPKVLKRPDPVEGMKALFGLILPQIVPQLQYLLKSHHCRRMFLHKVDSFSNGSSFFLALELVFFFIFT